MTAASHSSNSSDVPLLSIVSPVYRAAEIVPELVQRISESVRTITDEFEIILVEDGSPDNSWDQIAAIGAHNSNVKGIKLSRNFGQHYAITAGLAHARGRYVVVMDCDLQHDPKYIPTMFAEAQQGHDIVFTCKQVRKHSLLRNLFAKCYNYVFNWLAESDTMFSNNEVGAYSLLSRKVVDAFCSIKDRDRHYLLVLRWLGFSSTYLTIEHSERHSGRSSYSFWKLVEHAISGITSQSTFLLRISVGIGLAFCALSITTAFALVILYFVYGFKEGWASVVVLILLSTGVTLMSIGVAGIYIGRTFEQSKERPLFIVDRTVNYHDE